MTFKLIPYLPLFHSSPSIAVKQKIVLWHQNRRVLKLYLGGGKYFGCRHCYCLTYESCQEHDARVDALRRDPERLRRILESGDTLQSLIAVKAAFKVRGYL